MKIIPAWCVIAATLAPVSSVSAQSLAQLARREEGRRQTIQATGRVFTNASLPDEIAAPAPASRLIDEPRVQAPTINQSSAAEDTPPSPADQFDDRDEDYWRGRARAIRQRLSRAQADVAALSVRAEGLANGPASQQSERELTQNALRTADSDFRALDIELIGFEKQARIAKIPTSWLR